SGALTADRRQTLEALADQALAARKGDAREVLTSMGAATAAIETLVSHLGAAASGKPSQPAGAVEVPLERRGPPRLVPTCSIRQPPAAASTRRSCGLRSALESVW